MSKTDIRLGSLISFDTERESDIIEFVQDLTAQHKLGRFIGYLLRLACETPEVLQYREKVQPILKEMEVLGITPRRDALFKQYDSEMLKIKQRIDEVYEMAEKLYTIALAGKALGLEERAEGLLAAHFVAKHQAAVLEEKFGRDSILYTYKLNSMQDAKKKAEDTLNTIIEIYGDVFSELQSAVTRLKEIEVAVVKANSIEVNSMENIQLSVNKSIKESDCLDEIAQDNKTEKISKTSNNDTETTNNNLTDLDASPFEQEEVEEFSVNDSLMAMLGD